MPRQQRQKLGRLSLLRLGGEAQVGTVKAGDEYPGLLHAEGSQNVGSRPRVRGRGQRKPRHAREAVRQACQFAVLRPELMAPLRNAMRLVDRQKRQLDAPKPVQHAVAKEPLRRNV